MRVSVDRYSAILSCVFALAITAGSASGQTLNAVDDRYQAVSGKVRPVEAPGILGNDTLNGGGLPGTAKAELLKSDNILYGTLNCPGTPSPSICADGSFEYVSDPLFAGEETFTYRVVDGVNVSNEATVTIKSTGCDGGPDVFGCWIESSYLAKLAEPNLTTFPLKTFQEGFEDQTVWGLVRDPSSAASVLSQQILWKPNNNTGS